MLPFTAALPTRRPVALEEKYRLRDMWTHRRVLYPFAMERGYMPGHNATNYDKWFMVTADYAIDYQEGYEPWYIAARCGPGQGSRVGRPGGRKMIR